MPSAPHHHITEAAESLTQFVDETAEPTDGWNHPDYAFRATSPMAEAAQALSRAIERTGSLIDRLDLDDKLTHDNEDRLSATVDEVRNLSKEAATYADELAATLKRLERVLIPLGHRNALAENAKRNGDTEGAASWNAGEPGVAAALAVLRAAGTRIAVIPGRKLLYREWHSEQGPQGAFIQPGHGRTLEVEWLMNGAFDERGMRTRDTKAVRPARNAALLEIAEAFRAAGWRVWNLESTNTATRRVLKVAVTPPADETSQGGGA